MVSKVQIEIIIPKTTLLLFFIGLTVDFATSVSIIAPPLLYKFCSIPQPLE